MEIGLKQKKNGLKRYQKNKKLKMLYSEYFIEG